jgi:Ser/Thr protein kinase RdoA (MazF antagonist)
MHYTELAEADQIFALEQVIPGVLKQYGIEARAIENVNHGYNSSFKVTSVAGREFALRINIAAGKSEPEVAAEMQWLEALAEQEQILAPRPLRTLDGQLFTKVFFAELERDFVAVIFEWIAGDEIEDAPTAAQLFELGQNMARLQEFARGLSFAGDAFLPNINNTMMNASDFLRAGQPQQLDDKLYGELLAALKQADAVYARLSTADNGQAPLQAIHADLHFGNVIQTEKKLAIIDFDDAGIGLPIQDLAISSYYIREDFEAEKHLKAGFASIAELPQISEQDYELLILGRMVLLVGVVLEATSAEIREFLPEFLRRTKLRLEHFGETGKLLLVK